MTFLNLRLMLLPGLLRRSDQTLLWPILCHPPDLLVQVLDPQMSVPSGHLEARMPENARQAIQVAAPLDVPACEGVAQIVPSKVGANVRPFDL